jgi:hypothetical protein
MVVEVRLVRVDEVVKERGVLEGVRMKLELVTCLDVTTVGGGHGEVGYGVMG